jgi:glycosyltransferase involved in cell wall biosynthesis
MRTRVIYRPVPQRTVRLVSRLFAPEVGAAAFRLKVLADAFVEQGNRVEVVTSRPPGRPPVDDGTLEVSRWPVLRDAGGNVRGYVQYLSFDGPAVLRLLLRRRPGLLVSEPPPTTGFVVRCVAALQRVPYVYYAADVWSDAAASTGAPALLVAGLRRVESWVLRGATVVLAVSTGVADQLRLMGVDDARVVVVGNGVDTHTFSPDGDRADGGPYFVYTGTMSEWQGAEVFVRALALHRRRHPGSRLVFLGQGSDRAHLEAVARDVAPGAVEFLGVVPPEEAARWLRGAVAALVSIRPDQGYDFARPTKIYAATGCGTPVVFAGKGASHDLVTAEALGWSPGYTDDAVAAAMDDAVSGADRPDRDHLVRWTVENASLAAAAAAAVAAVEERIPRR